MTLPPAQLDSSSDYEVQIPKSISGSSYQGSGPRDVHGGASLQEIVVPVVSVANKSEAREVSHVNLAIQQKPTRSPLTACPYGSTR